ncbi:MAG: UPF0175 family protein [Trichodesmium sp. MAG_R04]|nr:UPF0175 family protein [Trichodesmium sp. MAG_R04]
MALLLYKQNKISSGKVRAWLGLTVLEFQHELAKRDRIYATALSIVAIS